MAFQSKDDNFRTTRQKSNGILKPNKTSRRQGLPVVPSAGFNKLCKTPYLNLFPFCTRRYTIFWDITGLTCTFSWKKTRWMIGLDYSITIKLFFYYKYVVQTFSVIYNKVAFLIWTEIWVAREVCMQNKLLYPMCLQGQ